MSEYSQDLRTSLENLDQHWLEQPGHFMKWGERWANAVATKDRAKENLEVLKAEIDKEIRKDWDKFGFDSKPTEPAIKSAIILEPRYKQASDEHIDAMEQVNIMAVAKSAFEHRKKQLDNLTSLYLAGFFSKPKLQDAHDPDYPLGNPQQQALNKIQGSKPIPRRRVR